MKVTVHIKGCSVEDTLELNIPGRFRNTLINILYKISNVPLYHQTKYKRTQELKLERNF
jgi:hypothetical protein